MLRLGVEYQIELAHQIGRRLGDPRPVRRLRDRLRMRRKRFERLPSPHIAGISDKRNVHPAQRLFQRAKALLLGKATPRHVLHDAMQRETRGRLLTRHKRIVGKVGERLGPILRLDFGNRGFKQRFRDRLGREKREPPHSALPRSDNCATEVCQVIASARG